MFTVLTINDKNQEKLGMLSIKTEDNKLTLNSSPFTPLSKENVINLIKALETHLKELK